MIDQNFVDLIEKVRYLMEFNNRTEDSFNRKSVV